MPAKTNTQTKALTKAQARALTKAGTKTELDIKASQPPLEPEPGEKAIDQALSQSFPASDPPPWTPGHVTPPARQDPSPRRRPDHEARGRKKPSTD